MTWRRRWRMRRRKGDDMVRWKRHSDAAGRRESRERECQSV